MPIFVNFNSVKRAVAYYSAGEVLYMAKTELKEELLSDEILEDGKKKSDKRGPKHRAERHIGRNLGITVGAIVVVAASAFTVVANKYSDIYPNTYISDTNISKMSESELETYLNRTYSADKLKGSTIKLICKDDSLDVKCSDLNISFDNEATLQQALNTGKTGNMFQNTFSFVKRFFTKEDIRPVISYDREKLAAAINEVTKKYEIEPVGHTFKINTDSVTVIGPVNGLKVNRDMAMDAVETQIKNLSPSSVELKPESVKPQALNADEFYAWLTSDAENAYYEKIDGKIGVHAGKPKCTVDREVVDKALSDLKSSADNTVNIPVTLTQPTDTEDKLKENLYKDQLGTYTTNFGGSSAARANNVRLAAQRINGTELMPDEEFSYDKAILPRTAANGYMAAPVYVGNKVESGLGGGICQPSSTLYVAALYANLEILERHNHSLAVGYMPPGMDATIAQGVLDLRFKNTTGYPVKINASANGGVLTFTIVGYNPEGISVELQRYASGGAYHLTRLVKKGGEVIKKEAMASSVYGKHEKN